jgi:hypothetical protein
MNYYYIINPGVKGWISHEDNELAHVSGYPGDVWVTENTAWAARVGATEKTKEEAQALVDAVINEAIANWTVESGMPEPQPIILP